MYFWFYMILTLFLLISVDGKPSSVEMEEGNRARALSTYDESSEEEGEFEELNHHEQQNNTTDDDQADDDEPDDVEPCLANQEKLSATTLARIGGERRRLVQAIRRMNKQQAMFCQPDLSQGQVPYRKCPIWRQEKLVYYYALMRVTYCSNSEKWPNATRPEEWAKNGSRTAEQ